MLSSFNETISSVDLELTGCCNLKCILCANNIEQFRYISKSFQRPVDDWIHQLETYKNLKKVFLAGVFSEPTLYKDLFHLIEYLKTRKIFIELNTNGCTHTTEWWYKLGEMFTHDTGEVLFTICGSNQCLHQKYRVGSNLNDIFNNVSEFQRCGNKNDVGQYIRFRYNSDDIENNYHILSKRFSTFRVINTLPYNERFSVVENKDFDMYDNSDRYCLLMKASLGKYNNFICPHMKEGFAYIDNFGIVYPCFLYRFYRGNDNLKTKTYFGNIKHEFCFECESHISNMMNYIKIERIV